MKLSAVFLFFLIPLLGFSQNEPCNNAFTMPQVLDLKTMTDTTRFKPQLKDSIISAYSFVILSRYGSPLFSTDIPQQGWNGLYNNRSGNAADGTYMWMLEYTANDSDKYSCRGFMTLSNSNTPVHVTGLDTLSCRPEIYVSDAFTPNQDGLYDEFTAQTGCLPVEYKMVIYDRWGETIYTTDDINKGWRGTNAAGSAYAPDVYVWRIEIRFYEGDKKRTYTGHVTLIR